MVPRTVRSSSLKPKPGACGWLWVLYGVCIGVSVFFFSGLIWVCNGLHGTIEDVVMLWEYNQLEGIWEYELAGIDRLLNNMSKDDPWIMFGSVDGLHSKKQQPTTSTICIQIL